MIKGLILALSLLLAGQQLPLGGIPISSGPTIPSVVQTFNTGLIAQSTTLAATGITAGNILVSVQYWGGGAAGLLDFTDTLGNTSTRLATTALTTDGDTEAIVCAPITTGGTDLISFRESSTVVSQRAVVYEVHNATCTQDVTAVKDNTLAATSCNSSAMTTTTANDFLVVACGGDGTSTSSIPAGSGWSGGTNTGNGGTQFIMMSEYQIGTVAGSYTGTSGTIPSQEQATLLVALKP